MAGEVRRVGPSQDELGYVWAGPSWLATASQVMVSQPGQVLHGLGEFCHARAGSSGSASPGFAVFRHGRLAVSSRAWSGCVMAGPSRYAWLSLVGAW